MRKDMLITLDEVSKMLGLSKDATSKRLRDRGIRPIFICSPKMAKRPPIRRSYYPLEVVNNNLERLVKRKKYRINDDFSVKTKINVRSPWFAGGIVDVKKLKDLKDGKKNVFFINRKNEVEQGVIKDLNSLVVTIENRNGKETSLLILNAGVTECPA